MDEKLPDPLLPGEVHQAKRCWIDPWELKKETIPIRWRPFPGHGAAHRIDKGSFLKKDPSAMARSIFNRSE